MGISDAGCSVIIVGAGISGISAAKVLVENGVDDVVILEATDRIGGRIRKEEFGGVPVEVGAGWITGIGGKQTNPVWELAQQSDLRCFFFNSSNIPYNIYDHSGKVLPGGIATDSYKKAVDSAIKKLTNQESNFEDDDADLILSKETTANGKTPLELAIDFVLHDFELADARPISTYKDFGKREYLVADKRGYEYLLYKMAETFLCASDGKILDSRLQLNKVVREIQQLGDGVFLKTEDGCSYKANYVILSVSIGVLRSSLISFMPPMPIWKTKSIKKCKITVYTKIFLRFPYKFWPCGADKEFFVYAYPKRGYYTFWQHLDNEYPDSNMLVVTLTNEESKRVEAQSDEETMKEAMEVLRSMFGPEIPEAIDILVPRWWNNRFQRGSYTNYPIYVDQQLIHDIKAPVGRIFFTGEHTSEKYSGYVHGGFLSGIETSEALLEEVRKEK